MTTKPKRVEMPVTKGLRIEAPGCRPVLLLQLPGEGEAVAV